MNVAPLAKMGGLSPEMDLALAIILGFGFGFFLERAGFGSAKKLTAQWFGKDWSVFRVMFSGIVVAMVGIIILDMTGIMPFGSFYLNSTYVGGQIVGGLLMGVGFVIGGYCPGTSFVGLATGHKDALFYIIGLGLGSLVFGEAYDLFQPIADSGAMGKVTLFEFFNVSATVVGVVVIAIAIFGFWVAGKVEAKVNGGS